MSETESFLMKVYGDMAGTINTLMLAIGDKYDLFKNIHFEGVADAQELAERTNLNERYLREWLRQMYAAGYLNFSATDGRYSIPESHVPVLVEEPSPTFVGSVAQQLRGSIHVYENIIDAFKTGNGVPQNKYPDMMFDEIARETRSWFEFLLIPHWIKQIDGLHEALEQGIKVADIGCGIGEALATMARAYPKSKFIGYDIHEYSIEQAKQKNIDLPNLEFRCKDITKGFEESFDFITAFDVLHDMAKPTVGMQTVYDALNPKGIFLVLEFISSDNEEDNVGMIPALMYGFSIMYCMSVSIADRGDGFGTLGLNGTKLRKHALDIGYSDFSQLEYEDPLNALYVLVK